MIIDLSDESMNSRYLFHSAKRGDDALDLFLVRSARPGRPHMHLASARGSHNVGDVVGAKPTGDQDDDVFPSPSHEASECLGPGHRRVSPGGENPVIAQLHEDIEPAIEILHLVEGAVEGERSLPRLVTQTSRRVDIDPASRLEHTHDEAEGNRGSPAHGGELGDVGGDPIDFFARVHEVSGARPHEHLDAASGSNLKGRRDLVESRG